MRGQVNLATIEEVVEMAVGELLESEPFTLEPDFESLMYSEMSC